MNTELSGVFLAALAIASRLLPDWAPNLIILFEHQMRPEGGIYSLFFRTLLFS